VIYRLFDEYNAWIIVKREQAKAESLSSIIRPGKVEVLPEYIFRRSNPAVVGVKVSGVIKPKTGLINSVGKRVGSIIQIQDRNVTIDEATDGMEVAISIRGPTIGRQVKENDVLYVDMPDKHVIAARTKFAEDLSRQELDVLEEIVQAKRASGSFV
jgi:translation initiation factor 5B